jgi:hypothetical protein
VISPSNGLLTRNLVTSSSRTHLVNVCVLKTNLRCLCTSRRPRHAIYLDIFSGIDIGARVDFSGHPSEIHRVSAVLFQDSNSSVPLSSRIPVTVQLFKCDREWTSKESPCVEKNTMGDGSQIRVRFRAPIVPCIAGLHSQGSAL